MTTYKTSKGEVIDMSSLAEKNAKLRAAGNMSVNAKGDEIRSDGSVVRPVRNRAQANHAMIAKDVRTVGLKTNETSETIFQETSSVSKKEEKAKPAQKKKVKEIVDEDGSITIEDDQFDEGET